VPFHRSAFSSKGLFAETPFHQTYTKGALHQKLFSPNLRLFIFGLFIEKAFLVHSFSRGIGTCSQICSGSSGSRDTDAQSFQTFLFQTQGSAEGGSGWKLSGILPCLSDIVTALANGAMGTAIATATVSGVSSRSQAYLPEATSGGSWQIGLASGKEKPQNFECLYIRS